MKILKWLRNIVVGIVSLILFTYLVVFSVFHISRYSSRTDIVEGSKIMELSKGEMEYAISGEGAPILFFHGAGGGYDQISSFSIEGHQIIAPSRPGYLRTPLLDDWKGYEQASAAYVELLDSLGIDKVTVGGISAGGPSAIYFAMLHPDRVNNMVLISAITKGRQNSKPPYRKPLLDRFFGEDFMAWIGINYVKFKPEIILGHPNSILSADDQRVILNDPVKEAALFNFMEHSYTFYKKRYAGHLNDIAQYANMGETDPLPVQVPTLVIHGDQDTNVTFDYAQSAVKRIPNATLYTIKNAGHLAIVSHFDEIQHRIAQFLSENPGVSKL
ncbi:alpha/beta hydrolase [Marinilabiliaceae bacterium JC017]|nr:alpha/beta hydrolase [Marinilabiliaceae bacterium JC017]